MATNSTFTVGIVQEAVTTDVGKNVERAEARIREAADKGAQIVCLQELFNAPYFCKSQKHDRFDLAEPIPGPTLEDGDDDHQLQLARELLHRFDRRPRNRLGQIESLVLLRLAEVRSIE